MNHIIQKEVAVEAQTEKTLSYPKYKLQELLTRSPESFNFFILNRGRVEPLADGNKARVKIGPMGSDEFESIYEYDMEMNLGENDNTVIFQSIPQSGNASCTLTVAMEPLSSESTKVQLHCNWLSVQSFPKKIPFKFIRYLVQRTVELLLIQGLKDIDSKLSGSN